MALSLIMVLALLVYRLAEHRLCEQLQTSGQTIPNQVNKPMARPTMRWVFQCFEGIELLQIRTGTTTELVVLRLQPLQHKILSLPGPICLIAALTILFKSGFFNGRRKQ